MWAAWLLSPSSLTSQYLKNSGFVNDLSGEELRIIRKCLKKENISSLLVTAETEKRAEFAIVHTFQYLMLYILHCSTV